MNTSICKSAVVSGALVACSILVGQVQTGGVSPEALQQAYSAHLQRVRKLLPQGSALPPLLDLASATSSADPGNHAWELEQKGIMGLQPITDLGVPTTQQMTDMIITTKELVGPLWSLPVKDSEAVFIAQPVASAAHFSQNQLFVYSTFSVKLLEVIKGQRKDGFDPGKEIQVVQYGGSLRFPSGHETTCLVTNEGFLGLAKQYVLFLWRRNPRDYLYIVAEAYLIENGRTLSVDNRGSESTYDGMPVAEFEAKLRKAVSKNKNTM